MISDWEIWACADKVIKQYASHATAHARARANELAEKGDSAGEAVWHNILSRIAVLQAERPQSAPFN